MLKELHQTIAGLRAANALAPHSSTLITTQWPSIDESLGGGLVSSLHEIYGVALHDPHSTAQGEWSPSIEIATHLARHGQQANVAKTWVAWIGRRCFPYPSFLVGAQGQSIDLVDRSFFIDAGTPANRLWAIEQTIQSSVVGVVVADGSRFNMAATRRIQLRAKSHHTFVFLLRPCSELNELSAAQSRWLVSYEPSTSIAIPPFVCPRWRLTLLRCKGLRSLTEQGCWILERDRASRTLCLSTELAHTANDTESGENELTARRTA